MQFQQSGLLDEQKRTKKTQTQGTKHKMKALKMQLQKSSRWLVIVLATVVLILTTMVVANATQTITTPNAAFISYNLASGRTAHRLHRPPTDRYWSWVAVPRLVSKE
jgi:uncharacterized membrane protein